MINGVTDDDSREAVFGRVLEVLNRLDQAKVWCRAGCQEGQRRRPDYRREAGTGAVAAGEQKAPRGRGDPQAGDGFLRQGDPVSVYPFIKAEKACRRDVKRACELLKVSRAALYQHLAGPSRRKRQDAELAAQITAVHQESKGRYGAPRHARARDGWYHGTRLHGSLGYRSPAEFEATHRTEIRNVA